MKEIIGLIFLLFSYISYGYINIYPTQIIESMGKDGITESVNLYNGSNKIRKYRIFFEDESSISKWTEYSPRGVTLLPGESRKVKVEIKAPAKTLKGRYIGKLIFKEVKVPNEKNKEEQVLYTEFRLPIIIYIGQKGTFNIELENLRGKKVDFFDIKGNNLLYTTGDTTYIKDIEKNQLLYTMPLKVEKRVGNYYLIKNDTGYGLVSLDLLNPYILGAEEITGSTNPNIFAVKKNGKYALYYGRTPLTEDNYDYIGNFKGNYAIFKKNKKFGIMMLDGQQILPPMANELYITKNGNWIGKVDGVYKTDKFKLQVEKIIPTAGSYFIYHKNGKYGLMDIDNYFLTEPKFDEIDQNIENGILVFNGKKYGIITVKDLKLNNEVEYKYDLIGHVGGDTYAEVDLKNGKYRYLNIYSGIYTKGIYDSIVQRGYAFFAIRGNDIDVYTHHGKMVTTVKKNRIVYVGDEFIVEDNGRDFIVTDMRGI